MRARNGRGGRQCVGALAWALLRAALLAEDLLLGFSDEVRGF